MFSCYRDGWRSFQIAPGTLVLLCEKHYIKEAREKYGSEYKLEDDTK